MVKASNLPTAWSGTSAYAADARVVDNYVVYQSNKAITAPTSGNNPNPRVSEDWDVRAVQRVTDYYNLIEAVALQLNVDENPEINDSIPLFIQQAENSFQTTIRGPFMIRHVELTVEEGTTANPLSRVAIPADLLQFKNVYISSDDVAVTGLNTQLYSSLVERGRLEINSLSNFEYRDIIINDGIAGTGYGSMGYYSDNGYLNFAPRLSDSTTIHIEYYAQLANLGTQVSVLNSAGDELNAAGQTEAQWIASSTDANPRTAANFVVDTELLTQNWYSVNAPQLLLYASILKGLGYLKTDPAKMQEWQQKYRVAYEEVVQMIREYESERPSSLYLESGYPV